MRQECGDVVDGCLLAVHHTEAIRDESAIIPDEVDQLLGQCQPLGVVLAGFAWIEADVLQQQDVSVGQALGTGQRIGAHDVTGELDMTAEPLPQRLCHRREGQLRI